MVGTLSDRIIRDVEKLSDFLASGFFAAIILSLVSVWTLISLAILFWPATFTPLAAFLGSMKIWCFGYNPSTGKFNMFHLLTVLLDPIFFGVTVGWIWKSQLFDFLKSQKVTAALLLAFSFAAVMLGLLGTARFETARLGAQGIVDITPIRVHENAPRFELTNQKGVKVLGPDSNQVTVVSAFYAQCQHTCPYIFQQAKRALTPLSERFGDRLKVVLISLDPKNDDPESLHDLAKQTKIPDSWHLLTGDVKIVNQVLDEYGVSRARAPDGTIGHSNLFYIIDKNQQLAFRISLGSSQETWLAKLAETLVQE